MLMLSNTIRISYWFYLQPKNGRKFYWVVVRWKSMKRYLGDIEGLSTGYIKHDVYVYYTWEKVSRILQLERQRFIWLLEKK